MKTKLIIINWLISFSMLCYVGEDLVIVFLLVAWFAHASHMLTKEKRKTGILIYLFEKRMLHLLKLN